MDKPEHVPDSFRLRPVACELVQLRGVAAGGLHGYYPVTFEPEHLGLCNVTLHAALRGFAAAAAARPASAAAAASSMATGAVAAALEMDGSGGGSRPGGMLLRQQLVQLVHAVADAAPVWQQQAATAQREQPRQRSSSRPAAARPASAPPGASSAPLPPLRKAMTGAAAPPPAVAADGASSSQEQAGLGAAMQMVTEALEQNAAGLSAWLDSLPAACLDPQTLHHLRQQLLLPAGQAQPQAPSAGSGGDLRKFGGTIEAASVVQLDALLDSRLQFAEHMTPALDAATAEAVLLNGLEAAAPGGPACRLEAPEGSDQLPAGQEEPSSPAEQLGAACRHWWQLLHRLAVDAAVARWVVRCRAPLLIAALQAEWQKQQGGFAATWLHLCGSSGGAAPPAAQSRPATAPVAGRGSKPGSLSSNGSHAAAEPFATRSISGAWRTGAPGEAAAALPAAGAIATWPHLTARASVLALRKRIKAGQASLDLPRIYSMRTYTKPHRHPLLFIDAGCAPAHARRLASLLQAPAAAAAATTEGGGGGADASSRATAGGSCSSNSRSGTAADSSVNTSRSTSGLLSVDPSDWPATVDSLQAATAPAGAVTHSVPGAAPAPEALNVNLNAQASAAAAAPMQLHLQAAAAAPPRPGSPSLGFSGRSVPGSPGRTPPLTREVRPSITGGTHVVVFVHGYQGVALDWYLVRGQLLLAWPHLDTMCSRANEQRTDDSIAEMGERLALEVRLHLLLFIYCLVWSGLVWLLRHTRRRCCPLAPQHAPLHHTHNPTPHTLSLTTNFHP